MGKFYSVSVRGGFASVLAIEKKRSIFKVLEEEVLELDELPVFLKDKRNFYVVIEAEELLDDVITVPSVIKGDNVLRSYIFKRFKDSLPTKDILLNYTKLSQDKDEGTITYKIDAIERKSYVKKLELIPNWKEIQSATIDKFALLNLSRKCFTQQKDYGYFSVFTSNNMVTVLAIDEHGEMLFERTSTSITQGDNSQYLNIVEEVNQTIAYVKQQFRSVSFSTLLIGGSLALDDQAAEHLLFSTELAIAVIYPNTFIEGLEDEEPQHYIVTLGAFLVHKKDRFLPDKVYSLKEFDISIKILLALSLLSFLISSNIAYENFKKYSNVLESYENIKARLLRMVQKTDTYPMDALEKSYKHLQIAEKFLRYHPSDFLLKIKPLIEMTPPQTYTFQDENEASVESHAFFTKGFTTLGGLYKFKQEFNKRFHALNKDNTLEFIDKTEYKKLEFKADIFQKVLQQANTQAPPPPPTGRRL